MDDIKGFIYLYVIIVITMIVGENKKHTKWLLELCNQEYNGNIQLTMSNIEKANTIQGGKQ